MLAEYAPRNLRPIATGWLCTRDYNAIGVRSVLATRNLQPITTGWLCTRLIHKVSRVRDDARIGLGARGAERATDAAGYVGLYSCMTVFLELISED